jgi:hypothetical protein
MAEETCPVCCLPPDHDGPHCDCANLPPDWLRPKPSTTAYDRERAARLASSEEDR